MRLGTNQKSIILYTRGDSLDPKTWSNVPYLFSRVLEERGIELIRVNIAPRPFYERLYYRWAKLARRLTGRPIIDCFHSSVHRAYVRRLVQRTRTNNSSTDLEIFLSYAFSFAEDAICPTVQFSDWPLSYYIKVRQGREPNSAELGAINREQRSMASADHVFTLFEQVSRDTSLHESGISLEFPGDVANVFLEPDLAAIYSHKPKSKRILFIGDEKYRKGLQALEEASELLSERYSIQHDVDVVGLSCESSSDRFRFHGYLDKSIESERRHFYQLLTGAAVIVNTTPGWGGYSSIVEAMYFGTPIIVGAYPDFIIRFGADLDCGMYCAEGDADALAQSLKSFFACDDRLEMCRAARRHVENNSWETLWEQMETRIFD